MAAALLCGGGVSLSAETRMWTGPDGKQFEGTYDKSLIGDVLIKDVKGKRHFLSINQLVKSDQDYIYSLVPPTVEIELEYETRQQPKTKWSRDDDDVTFYTFTATLEKESRLPYRGRLSAELFVLADERSVLAKDHLVLMSYTKKNFTFPEQKVSQYQFSVPDVLFNAYRASWVQGSVVERGKDYLGYILVISDSTGQMVAFDTDIANFGWLLKDKPHTVEGLRRLYHENRGSIESRHFDELFRKIAPPRIPWFQRTRAG